MNGSRRFFKGKLMNKTVLAMILATSLNAYALDIYQPEGKEPPFKEVTVEMSLQQAVYNTKIALTKCNDEQSDLFHPHSLITDSTYPEFGVGNIVAYGVLGGGLMPHYVINFYAENGHTKIKVWYKKSLLDTGNFKETSSSIDKLATDAGNFDCSIINGKRIEQKQPSVFGN